MYRSPKRYNQNFLKRLAGETLLLCLILMKDRSLKRRIDVWP